MKYFIFSVLTFLCCDIVAQEMPLKLGELPKGTKFEFLRKLEMFEDAETVLYHVNISETANFFRISTDNLPDVMIVPNNAYGGGELYRKLTDGTYLRILECRKNGDNYGLYRIDSENISSLFFSTPVTDDGLLAPLILAYRLYWSEINTQR